MGRIKQRADKRKMKWLLLISIIVILIILISWYFIFFSEEEEHDLVDDWDHLRLKQKKVEDGWLIEITAHKAWADKNEDGFPLTDVYYLLSSNSQGYVVDINGIYDENETIIFNDNDTNNLFSNGDTFFISNNIDENVPTGGQFIIMVNGLTDRVILN